MEQQLTTVASLTPGEAGGVSPFPVNMKPWSCIVGMGAENNPVVGAVIRMISSTLIVQ